MPAIVSSHPFRPGRALPADICETCGGSRADHKQLTETSHGAELQAKERTSVVEVPENVITPAPSAPPIPARRIVGTVGALTPAELQRHVAAGFTQFILRNPTTSDEVITDTATLAPERVCQKCGKSMSTELANSSGICTRCGTQLKQPVPEPPILAPETPSAETPQVPKIPKGAKCKKCGAKNAPLTAAGLCGACQVPPTS